MATAEEALQPEIEAPVVRRTHVRFRLLAGFMLGFAVVVGIAAGALYAVWQHHRSYGY